jgi:hypothetical protein
LTDGVTDFGLAGGLAYMSGIVIILCCGMWFFRKFDRPFTIMMAGLTLIHLALRPEITLSEYLVTIRNLVWVVPLVFVCEYVWSTTFDETGPELYDLRN